MKTTVSSLLASLLFASLAACTVPSAPCESNSDCDEGQSCNLAENQCVASPERDASFESDAGSNDATPAHCDPEKSRCLSEIPSGWSGPLIDRQSGIEDPAPGCTDVYSEALPLQFSEIDAGGDCSCECGEASQLSCTSAVVREWKTGDQSCEMNVCDILGGGCLENSMTVPPSDGQFCTPIPSFMRDESRFQVSSFGQLQGGSCQAPRVESSLLANFSKQHQLCRAEQSPNCPEGESCAPIPAKDAPVCIAKAGDHLCPEGDFQEKTLLFSDLVDERSCDDSSCSCDAPTGSCGGRVEVRSGNEFSCGSELDTMRPNTSIIGNNGNRCEDTSGARNLRFIPNLSHSCQKSGEAEIAGQVRGTEATTICCSALP